MSVSDLAFNRESDEHCRSPAQLALCTNAAAMELHDSFGQTTLLRFSNMERNPALPAEMFRFVPPPGADVVGE